MFTNNREWERTEDIGLLPPRCYYTPFDRADEYDKDRENSSRYFSLRGEWSFRAHKRLETCLLEEDLPDTIAVPSCVQMKGYDGLQYTNIRYPYPFNPPYIDKDIPAYHYRRTVKIENNGKIPRLVFEGVDSAFYVFLNGEFLGYSQITHRLTEFDLSAARKGENTLDVIVLKWNASSYLEDQDKWRFTGIFGDVYLLYRDENAVEDYFIKTKKTSDYAWTLSFENLRGGDCLVAFEGETKNVKAGETACFVVENPRLWSAEIPDLYPLTIQSGDETIYEEVGFREMKIEKGVFYLNEQPIKLYGVNRHEFHPEKGAAISLADAENDIRIMKTYHVNAIRTSHYPNMPEFYRLCDRYGMYVVDEADVETHGAVMTDGNWTIDEYKEIADGELYESAIVARTETMVRRDKNRACVIFWSLGNESYYGKNFRKAARKAKEIDDTRFVHYEQHCYIKDTDEYYTDEIDVVSRMYAPPYIWVRDEYLKDKRETRPMMLCEYCHAMGNGPGDLEEYWKVFRSSNRCMGGFVWEWADHGVLKDGKYYYGGDFGENLHDSNYCIDGIVSPDRKGKAGTLCMKHVYQPAEFSYKNGKLTVKNRCFFKSLKGEVYAEIKANGKIASVLKKAVEIPAGKKKTFAFSVDEARYAGQFLGLSATFIDCAGLTSEDFFTLQEFSAREEEQRRFSAAFTAHGVKTTDSEYVISDGDVALTIDRATGNLLSAKRGEKEYLAEPLQLSVTRAPTDNERIEKNAWNVFGLYDALPRVRAEGVWKDGELILQGQISRDSCRSALDYSLTYAVVEGGFTVKLAYKFGKYVKRLPAAGFRFAVKGGNEKVEYFGYGPQETYRDTIPAAKKDLYSYKAKEGYHRYVKPQESGNHAATEYVKVRGMEIGAFAPFDFSAIPYSAEQLAKKQHDFELRETGKTYVFIGETEGVGSHSCGPVLLEKYRIADHGELTFTFRLR